MEQENIGCGEVHFCFPCLTLVLIWVSGKTCFNNVIYGERVKYVREVLSQLA